jgi:L-amino acid N-acyltransferase YncA
MKIRVATPEDAAACAGIYAPFVRDTRVTFEEEVPSPQGMEGRIRKVLATHPWLVLDHEGVAVGYAYGSVNRDRRAYRWGTDTTIYLAEGQTGKGYGRRIYEVLLAILKAQGFVTAYAGIALPNEASVRLHESLGYGPVALYPGAGFKSGAWHDVGWWALDLNDRLTPPLEPIAFPDLDPELLAAILGG